MKKLIPIITAMVFACMFIQCKKGKTPAPPVAKEDKLIEKGKYIIRTKYFCNGGCFVFRSFSNYETITWEWTTKENLEGIKKETNSFNDYVWDIAKTGAIGSGIVIYPNPSGSNGISEQLMNPLNYYAVYQEKPDGFFHYLPNSPRLGDYPPDEAETGGLSKYVQTISTDISPVSNDFDHDLARIFIREATDSTHRIQLMHDGMWTTWFSLLADPDGSDCDEPGNINNRPTWRNSWLCPNTAYIDDGLGSIWRLDGCYTSQLVLEKVD